MIRNSLIKFVFFTLLFSGCKNTFLPVDTKTTFYEITGGSASRSQDSIIGPYKNQLDLLMKKFLVLSEGEFTKDGDENALGNFICDAMRWAHDSIRNKTSPEMIVLMNRGGMRASISKGNISVNHIFELMPFDNELELCEISGKDLNTIISAIIDKKHSFSGLKITSNSNSVEATDAQGNPVENNKTYYLLTSDYLVNGGDNFTFGKTKIKSEKLNVLLRNAIINYCMHLHHSGNKAIPYTDGRLVISK
jgi:2',3'-cyclic-nucleotide 2'-phosphodiesterase (5'-nucleotidase family)